MIALLQAKAAGLWSRGHIGNNVLAGVVVGIVALPLAMAFAIASGARPEQGLYTAIVAAMMTSIFGGTRVQVSGPTGAFIAVLAIITAQHGIAGLQIASFHWPTKMMTAIPAVKPTMTGLGGDHHRFQAAWRNRSVG